MRVRATQPCPDVLAQSHLRGSVSPSLSLALVSLWRGERAKEEVGVTGREAEKGKHRTDKEAGEERRAEEDKGRKREE